MKLPSPALVGLVLYPPVLLFAVLGWLKGGHFCADSAFYVFVLVLWWLKALVRFRQEQDVQNHSEDCDCCEAVPDEA